MTQILSTDEIDALMRGLEEGSIDLDEVEDDLPRDAISDDDESVTSFSLVRKRQFGQVLCPVWI